MFLNGTVFGFCLLEKSSRNFGDFLAVEYISSVSDHLDVFGVPLNVFGSPYLYQMIQKLLFPKFQVVLGFGCGPSFGEAGLPWTRRPKMLRPWNSMEWSFRPRVHSQTLHVSWCFMMVQCSSIQSVMTLAALQLVKLSIVWRFSNTRTCRPWAIAWRNPRLELGLLHQDLALNVPRQVCDKNADSVEPWNWKRIPALTHFVQIRSKHIVNSH